ncbi:MAG: NAD+ synthase [Thermoplasmata archaeon]
MPELPAHAAATIHSFLRSHVLGDGIEGVVVGLSGGIDSALVVRLAADALGKDRVLGVLLPDAAFPEALRAETEAYADTLGIERRTVVITPIENAFRAALPEVADRVTWGNTKARIRMTTLYALARERRRLVLGTGNKSEILLGYFTKYGDGGVDLLPIGDLYKTQVCVFAAQLELPAPVRQRPPSAGLWPDQTDEAELGLGYAEIDRILAALEEGESVGEIARATALSLETVRGIADRVERNLHKRVPTPIAKLSGKTIATGGHAEPSHGARRARP